MIDHRVATQADVRHVVYRMWQRGEDEIAAYGFADKEALIAMFLNSTKEHRYALHHDGHAVAVFGAHEHEGVHYTLFLATDGFLHVGKSATRWLRRFLREKTAEKPDAKIELHTAVEHDQADRWFRLLGFHELAPDRIFRRYAYLPAK